MIAATRSVASTALAGLLLAGAIAAPVAAQQVFRIVGPDGRVTFSDKPPETPNAKAAPVNAAGNTAAAGAGSALPFELRQIASRYPVVIYTGNNCAPCGSGRAYLSGRGIPFTEKTIVSNEDIDALQRLTGSSSLPALSIGGQQLRGFSEVEWAQFLDAAGYPKTSQLPAGYRNPPAGPLVAVQTKPADATPPQAAAPAAAPLPAGPAEPPPSNPAGIRF